MSTQPLSNSQRTQAISEIDRRIDHCLQELQSLRSQRNCLASQTQYLLPPDILLSIFLIYQKREVLEFKLRSRYSSWPQEPGRGRYCPLPYLVPSHVCAHWRRIALDYPPFWSVLFLNNTKWIKELLIRSKTSPLRLHLHLTENIAYSYHATSEGGQLLAGLKMAQIASHRFESLDLSGSQDSSFNLLSNEKGLDKALKKALRSLHRLRLEIGSGYGSFNSWNADPSSRFTDHLGEKLPPKLRSLEICAVSPVSLGSGLASSILTRLECRDLPSHRRPPVVFYLKLLSRLPALEVLILDRALPSNPDEGQPETASHASLKNLTLLGEDTSLRVYTQIFEHLTLPPVALLHLSGRCISSGSDSLQRWDARIGTAVPTPAELREDFSSLFVALQPYLTSSNHKLGTKAPTPFHSMVVESTLNGINLLFARENKIAIDKVGLPDASHHFREYTNVDIKLELTNVAYIQLNPIDAMNVDSDSSRIVLELLHDIVQTVEHAVLVENVHPAGPPPRSLVPWIEAFSESGALKELDLKLSTCFQSLLSSMDPIRTQQLNGEKPSLTFPALEKIIVREVNFLTPLPASPSPSGSASLPEPLENGIPPPRSLPNVLEDRPLDETSPPSDTHSLPPSPSPPLSPPNGYQPWQAIELGVPPRTFFLPSLEGKDFPSVFRARKAAGQSIRTLSFHNCASFDPSISLHFVDTIEEVRWDGLDSKFWNLWQSPQVPHAQGLPAETEDQSSGEESDEEPQHSA
ncbi:hypothetical protein DL96DRAFT_1814162 [Flagelloscypha sp. PMI_526]|nr:hypothetical protein DL96DRAFT_1814162 [Flagelloscypha sp. PMI_526]